MNKTILVLLLAIGALVTPQLSFKALSDPPRDPNARPPRGVRVSVSGYFSITDPSDGVRDRRVEAFGYLNINGQRAWTRQLQGTIERRHEDRLMEAIERFDGLAFPTMPRLARQWVAGRWRRQPSALETLYCAELVASTYQHMGLLPSQRPAGWYDPGRFWSGDHIELVTPFELADEVAVEV